MISVALQTFYPKAESLLYVSLGSSPEGAPSLGTTQNGIARCKRAVSQDPKINSKYPKVMTKAESNGTRTSWNS